MIGFVVITLCLRMFNVLLGCIFGLDGCLLMRLKLSFKEYF